MATKPISVGDQFQGGRVDTTPNTLGSTFIRYVDINDLGTDTLQFQFSNAQSVGLTFGQCRCVFIDNALNDYAMQVVVSGTLQSFPVPPNSTGWYPIDAQGGSNIEVTSAGNPVGPVEFIFYNYDRVPFVYYKFGAATTAVTVADGADVAQGSVADAPVTNPALSGTVISLLKGIISKLSTATTGTAVTIANGADVTQGAVADAAVTNPASSGSVIALLKGVLTAVNTVATQIVNVVTNTSDTVTNTADIVTNTSAFSFRNITTSTTTVVKNAPGTLGKITVNSAGGAGSIIVYNNTAGSGTVIATLDSAVVGSFDYNVLATIGVTVVTTGAPDVTVTYK